MRPQVASSPLAADPGRPRATRPGSRLHIFGLLLAACGADESVQVQPQLDAPPVARASVDTPTPAPPPAAALAWARVPAAPAGPPGPAYFAVGDGGVVRLDGGGFSPVAGGPQGRVVDMQRGGDGAVWLAGSDGIHRLEGDRFRKVAAADFRELEAAVDAFSVGPNGELWVATFRGVGRFDGHAWRREDKSTFVGGEALLYGIAVDRGGTDRVWVASTHALHLREGETWRTVELGGAGLQGEPYFNALRQGPDGALYLLATSALLRVGAGPGEVAQVGLGSAGHVSYADLAIADNGALVVRDGDNVTVVPAGGPPRRHDGHTGADFVAHNIRATAVDDGGRVWVASDVGVTVLGPGAAKTEWPKGSVPALVGGVEAMLVIGSGPARLPAAGPVRKGGLTGNLLRDGAALPGIEVELCPSPAMMFHDTPCTDAPIKFATVSDQNGVWTVQDVPLGAYGIAVKLDGKWRITLGERLGEGMQADKIFDTGSLVLDR